MKRFLLVFVLLMTFAVLSFAVESEKKVTNSNTNKIRILLFTGGHSYDEKEFMALFRVRPDFELTHATLPEQIDLLAPGLEKKFDLILFYDQNNHPVTEQQRSNWKELLNRGIGVFVLHHHLSCNQDWPDYYRLTGARDFAFRDDIVLDGKRYPRSTFIDNVTMKIQVVDPNHPITRNVKDFTIVDEAYGKCLVLPEALPILTTEHPKATKVVAWTWKYGKSPVFGNMLGHDAKGLNNPAFKKVFYQAIDYLYQETMNIRSKK